MESKNKNEKKITTIDICISAVLMSLNVILSSFSIPVPGGHLYLCDVAICIAAILLNPFLAFVVGGVGSFIGDFIFYPAPMFVSLVTHGVQAIVISVFSHYVLKKRPLISSGIGVILGAIIMVAGYTFGRAFVYSTPEYALIKLPYEILQGVLGAVLGMISCWAFKLRKIYLELKEKRLK